jgi:hypothetical protein
MLDKIAADNFQVTLLVQRIQILRDILRLRRWTSTRDYEDKSNGTACKVMVLQPHLLHRKENQMKHLNSQKKSFSRALTYSVQDDSSRMFAGY